MSSKRTSTVPRPKSDNDTAVSLLLPTPWLEELTKLVSDMSQPGAALTRADVMRVALRRGIDVLRAEIRASKKR